MNSELENVVDQMCLLDDTFFNLVFKDNKKLIEEILSILLEKEIHLKTLLVQEKLPRSIRKEKKYSNGYFVY